MATLQASLFDLASELEIADLAAGVEHLEVGRGAWLELRRSFLSGTVPLLDRLLEVVPWRAERRPMYDRVVDVPRLHAFYEEGAPLPHPSLQAMLEALVRHYGARSGGPFRTAGLCWYRNGRDSVAWHGDRIGRGARVDTIVAIVSLGATRRLLLRPRGGGGPSHRFDLGAGDLFVMGGSCQRTFEHSVPKTARAVGPRVSVQFRPSGVR